MRTESELEDIRDDEANEWEFAEGDVIQECHDPSKTEYRIKWRLRKESDGKRCYLVKKGEGGTHLFTAATVEGRYEVIDVSESLAFTEGDE